MFIPYGGAYFPHMVCGRGVFSLSRAYFVDGHRIPVVILQGLKPYIYQALFGTTEFVP